MKKKQEESHRGGYEVPSCTFVELLTESAVLAGSTIVELETENHIKIDDSSNWN